MLKQIQVTLFLLFLNIGYGQQLSLHLSSTAFIPAGVQFKRIYGPTLAFSGGIETAIAENISIGIGLRYLTAHGETSFTEETTDLKIYLINIMGRYSFQFEKYTPNIGIGFGSNLLKESNPIGEITTETTGVLIDGGVRTRLSNSLYLDTSLSYLSSRVKAENGWVDLGGFGFTLGIVKNFSAKEIIYIE
jgi:opacity protein-like surface antigen